MTGAESKILGSEKTGCVESLTIIYPTHHHIRPTILPAPCASHKPPCMAWTVILAWRAGDVAVHTDPRAIESVNLRQQGRRSHGAHMHEAALVLGPEFDCSTQSGSEL